MTRTYVQRARAEATVATQRRLIEAARFVLTSGSVPRLELADVAGQAGVARSTIYLSFGTRSAFMTRILDDSLSRAGFARLREYFVLPDALEALEKTLDQTAFMYAREHTVLKRMLALAPLDPDVSQDYQARQGRRAAGMRDLARRLRAQGHLGTALSVPKAAAVLWVLTSFETFDQLFSGWGLSASGCASQLQLMARASLL